MRLVWTTDIHLDYVPPAQITPFYDSLVAAQPDAILITGDIGEGEKLEVYLHQLAEHVQKPVYFVLGNHDYYTRSVQTVRSNMRQINAADSHLHWLSELGPVELTPEVALVGHDGWSDGRYGDFMASTISLTDYRSIKELMGLSLEDLLEKLHQYGDEAADCFSKTLPDVLANYPKVVVALHPPPYQETCYGMDGRVAEDDNPYLPHFTCKAVGDVLLQLAADYPQCQIEILAGHTHHAADAQMRENLHVIVAGVEYEKPAISKIFDF